MVKPYPSYGLGLGFESHTMPFLYHLFIFILLNLNSKVTLFGET